MRQIHKILMLFVLLVAQQVFADDTVILDSSHNKHCEAIANACLSAGYVRTETANKRIWQDCMKPIILGKNVSGVTVDSSAAKDCRAHKIEEMKVELKEFEKA